MGISITVDEKLVEAAKQLTGLSSESDAVEQALRRFVAERQPGRQSPSLASFAGQFQFADGYDVLKERGARGISD